MKSEKNIDKFIWVKGDLEFDTSEDKPEGKAGEKAELHYGGADGHQPRPDGTPQTVHGLKSTKVGTPNPLARSRAGNAKLIFEIYKEKFGHLQNVDTETFREFVVANYGVDYDQFTNGMDVLLYEKKLLRKLPQGKFTIVGTIEAPAPKQPSLDEQVKELTTSTLDKIKQELYERRTGGAKFNKVFDDKTLSDYSKKIINAKASEIWEEKMMHVYGTDLATMASFYDYKDESGITTSVTSVRGTPNGNVFLRGEIKDAKGNYVGYFERVFDGNGSVRNSYFDLSDKLENNGFGRRFYKHTEELLLATGAKRILLHANVESGSYAWARMGFDQVENGFAETADWLNISGMNSLAQTEWSNSYKAAKDNGYAGDFVEYAPASTMYEFASYSSPWDSSVKSKYPDANSFAKRFLIGKDWMAVKEISIESPSFIAGEIYYRASK